MWIFNSSVEYQSVCGGLVVVTCVSGKEELATLRSHQRQLHILWAFGLAVFGAEPLEQVCGGFSFDLQFPSDMVLNIFPCAYLPPLYLLP